MGHIDYTSELKKLSSNFLLKTSNEGRQLRGHLERCRRRQEKTEWNRIKQGMINKGYVWEDSYTTNEEHQEYYRENA